MPDDGRTDWPTPGSNESRHGVSVDKTEIVEEYGHDYQITKVTKPDSPARCYFEDPLDKIKKFVFPTECWTATIRSHAQLILHVLQG